MIKSKIEVAASLRMAETAERGYSYGVLIIKLLPVNWLQKSNDVPRKKLSVHTVRAER